MLEETFIEMERGAKALDLSDINTAAVCLRKALEGHTEMAPPGPTPPAQAVGPLAELAKSINALEIKDFSLACLCCEKAAGKLRGRLPETVHSSLVGVARAVRSKDFSTAAGQLRAIIRHYRADMTIPAPAEAPNVQPLGTEPIPAHRSLAEQPLGTPLQADEEPGVDLLFHGDPAVVPVPEAAPALPRF